MLLWGPNYHTILNYWTDALSFLAIASRVFRACKFPPISTIPPKRRKCSQNSNYVRGDFYSTNLGKMHYRLKLSHHLVQQKYRSHEEGLLNPFGILEEGVNYSQGCIARASLFAVGVQCIIATTHVTPVLLDSGFVPSRRLIAGTRYWVESSKSWSQDSTAPGLIKRFLLPSRSSIIQVSPFASFFREKLPSHTPRAHVDLPKD